MKYQEVITEAIDLTRHNSQIIRMFYECLEETVADIIQNKTLLDLYVSGSDLDRQHINLIRDKIKDMETAGTITPEVAQQMRFSPLDHMNLISRGKENPTPAQSYPRLFLYFINAFLKNFNLTCQYYFNQHGISISRISLFPDKPGEKFGAIAVRNRIAFKRQYYEFLLGYIFNEIFLTDQEPGDLHKIIVNIEDNLSEKTETRIHEFARLMIHELTHVYQHQRQEEKGRTSMDYRSYLSDPKKKDDAGDDELVQLLSKIDGNTASPDEEKRFWKLYFSSPQEIGAYASEHGLKIITDILGKDFKTQEIPPINELKDQIREKIRSSIDYDPETKAEHRVYNRYQKIVYQIIYNNLERLRSQSIQPVSRPRFVKKIGDTISDLFTTAMRETIHQAFTDILDDNTRDNFEFFKLYDSPDSEEIRDEDRENGFKEYLLLGVAEIITGLFTEKFEESLNDLLENLGSNVKVIHTDRINPSISRKFPRINDSKLIIYRQIYFDEIVNHLKNYWRFPNMEKYMDVIEFVFRRIKQSAPRKQGTVAMVDRFSRRLAQQIHDELNRPKSSNEA